MENNLDNDGRNNIENPENETGNDNNAEVTDNGDSQNVPDNNEHPRLKEGIKEIRKDPLVITMLIIWVLLVFLRLYAVYTTPPAERTAPEIQAVNITENFLYLKFFQYREDVDAQTVRPFMTMIHNSAEEVFSEAIEQYPDNETLNYQYIMVLHSAGKTEEAESFYEENRDVIVTSEIRTIIEEIYLSEEEPELTENRINELEQSINENLSGWFRDNSLLVLYRKTESEERLQALVANVLNRITPRLVLLGVVGGIVGLGALLGIILFPVLIFLTLKPEYKKLTLEENGIRQSSHPLFSILTLKKALLIFLTWEIFRGFFAAIAQIILILLTPQRTQQDIMRNIGITTFLTYSFIYAFILFIILRIFRTTPVRTFFEATGLKLKKAGEVIKMFFLGILSYFAAIPVIVIASLIYSLIFRHEAQSVNPVFEYIRTAGDTLNIVLLFLVVGILAPIFEEILFRGILYTSLRRYMPAVSSTIIISLLFAFIHFDLGVLFQLFFLSAILTVVYERSGSLIPSIVLHCVWNSVVFVLSVVMFT
jgi:uncharacterized protein